MADAIRAYYVRILTALRRRSGRDVRAPSIAELEFIRLTINHGEFCEKLRQLGQPETGELLAGNALYVGLRWLSLGKEHLEDARSALAGGRVRSVYSRSYYAAYNASKCVRYLVSGSVSLIGDDHGRASELPDDFPHVVKRSETITKLYEHRLLADYENWEGTQAKISLPPRETLQMAEEFVSDCCKYLGAKLGISI